MDLAGVLVHYKRGTSDELVTEVPRLEPPSSRNVEDPCPRVFLDLPDGDLVLRTCRGWPARQHLADGLACLRLGHHNPRLATLAPTAVPGADASRDGSTKRQSHSHAPPGRTSPPSSLAVAHSAGDHALCYGVPPVNRFTPILRLLDGLGEPLKERLSRDSLPSGWMVIGVVAEIPEAVREPALDVCHCRMLGRRLAEVAG
jgi:hypothetical protein